jgi:hypothetical protein
MAILPFHPLLEHVCIAERILYFQDDALAHFSRAALDVLSNTYHDRQIGRGGPTAWPPCLPDSNPLHFYLWGLQNRLVYAAPVDNEKALHHHIVDACQTIHNYPGISEQMWWSTVRRVETCIDSHLGHFERLL